MTRGLADVVVGGAVDVGVVTRVVVGGAVGVGVVTGVVVGASGASVSGDSVEYNRSLDSP